VPVGEDRLPTWADFEEMRDACVAVVPVADRSVANLLRRGDRSSAERRDGAAGPLEAGVVDCQAVV
jgi:hypothetical protein